MNAPAVTAIRTAAVSAVATQPRADRRGRRTRPRDGGGDPHRCPHTASTGALISQRTCTALCVQTTSGRARRAPALQREPSASSGRGDALSASKDERAADGLLPSTNASRSLCYRATGKDQRRRVTVRRQPEFLALQEARRRETIEDFRATYAKRAGSEGTLSHAVRRCRLRRTRYSGQARVQLGHILTAVAINFVRLGEWFTDLPRSKTWSPPLCC